MQLKTTVRTLLFSLIFLSSFCSKDEQIVIPSINEFNNAVYIVNEGNFMRGNASLSFYLPDSNKVYNDIYQIINGKKLGDVAQNMYIKDGKGYIVVNNSNKIVIIDVSTNRLIDTITTHLNSPRAICFYSNKMFVSNLYGSSITVLSGENYKTFIKEIVVKSNPDEMVLVNDKIYCGHSSGYQAPSNDLSIIDAKNDLVLKTIKIGYNPTMLKSCPLGIIVLCSGEYNDFTNPNDDIFAQLFIIDPNTEKVSDSLFVGGHAMDFDVENKDLINYAYIVGENGIIKVDITNKKVINASFIAGYFYSIAYESNRKELYIGDAKDYVSNGEMLIYDMNGNLKTKFTVGLIPGAFCFYSK
jgi:YVTN family beta-propeller protein